MANGYTIVLTRGAGKELDKLDRPVLNRVVPQIDALANEPRPAGCRKLVNKTKMWRVRVGDWRILYEIDDLARAVKIIAVRHRNEAYK